MINEEDDSLDWLNVYKKKRRNTGKRPGGSNVNGRKIYENSEWGQMIRHPGLQVLGSLEQKTFMRRFRVPYAIFFDCVVVSVKNFLS